MRLVIGLLLGAALAGGGAFAWLRSTGGALDGCLGRCGDGTRCQEHRCALAPVVASAPPPPKEERKRRRRGGNGSAAGVTDAPPVVLQPGDDKMVAQGDGLGRPERIDLSKPGDDGKELSQDELDAVFHKADDALVRCIDDARGEAPLDGTKVEIGLRVEPSGSVSRVRVAAPSYLQKHGLARCMRPVVTGLKFPRGGGAAVVTYPFQLK